MLLNDNTEKVIKLINIFDDLKDVDKLRLTIHIFEDLGFATDYDIDSLVVLLKEVLGQLDSNYSRTIVNFAKYKNLLFISSKYMELTTMEKQKFSVEILFNIIQNDFNNENINNKVSKLPDVYEYYYSLNI